MPPARRSLEERFWAKVQIRYVDGTQRPDVHQCWPWTGAKNGGQPNGAEPRGHLRAGGKHGKMIKAHIVSFELANGRKVREGYDVCHDGGVDAAGNKRRCDSPLCVNPFHLFEARHRENVRDWIMENKRNRHGHWTARPGKDVDAQAD